MRRFIFSTFLSIMTTWSYAQYSNIKIDEGNKDLHVKIVHIDYDVSGTYLFLKHKAPSPMSNFEKICWEPTIKESIYLRVTGDELQKKYRLLNSFNMPLYSDDANACYAQCTKDGQEINYVLMFEPIPEGAIFDLIEDENSEGAFNIYKISPNKDKKGEYMNIANFINETPLSKIWWTMKEGKSIGTVENGNIVVNATCSSGVEYGKYYFVDIYFINYSDKNILIRPEAIKAYAYNTKKDELTELKVLSDTEYIKKVKKSQNWTNALGAIANGLKEVSPNNQAGMSYSTTVTANDKSSASSSFLTSQYGSSYGIANSYTSKFGATYTQTYDANAAYWIKQNENQKIQEMLQNQYTIRQALSDEYIKMHTVEPKSSYHSRFNIKWKKADYICFIITINGKDYRFRWRCS